MNVHPMPPGPPIRKAPPTHAQHLLRDARRLLAEAAESSHPNLRYATAHLAALRAAAAVLAVRGPVAPARGRPRTAWVLLEQAEPLLAQWAAFFAAGAPTRAAAEAGLPGATTPAEADDLLHSTETFLTVVEDTLHIPTQQSLPLTG
ncbi:SAV_6107 family HEPN domain-containing protein [Actinocorallia sp. A-T 12471]|uniref:SAV_6107 family HEPN domain-containing protein n=1 Tax=Actinocorallia sp. A-T 12471 TaxID=3089813 RepID=UPI0029CBA504|nr:SAV_6107 family HEPN domain-containing protein [Actinocorallia sp. A-T 12471]MDX6743150.1 SAV_6107 family HEPN domain-containing protein [Actinocorallia sp. A-T 12471]